MPRPLEEAWVTYRDGVLPKDAPQVQIDECKKAFFAGAFTHSSLMMQVSQEGVAEDHAVEILNGVDREIRQYVASVLPRDPSRN